MIDSVSLLMNALREMVKGDPTILRNALRGDRVLNSNGSYGIDCQADPVTPWYLGVHLRQHLKQVPLIWSNMECKSSLSIKLFLVNELQSQKVIIGCANFKSVFEFNTLTITEKLIFSEFVFINSLQ